MSHAYQFKYDRPNSHTDPFDCYLTCKKCTAQTKNGQICRNNVCIGINDPSYCHIHMKSKLQLQLQNVEDMGKGLFAYDKTKHIANEPIFKADDIICSYNGQKITTQKNNQRYGTGQVFAGPYTVSQRIIRKPNRVEDAACLRGLGAMVNHDPNPNAVIILHKNKFKIKAIEDIFHNEQIFVNYGYNPVDNLYNVNTSTKYKKRV